MAVNAQGMTQFQLIGVAEMQRKTKTEWDAMRNRIAQALRLEAERIMTRAKRQYVPVDKGALRSSGFVRSVQVRNDEMTCAIGFGGTAAPYALSVHEHPSAYSPPSWRGKSVSDINSVRTRKGSRQPWSDTSGRGPKFLERAMRDAESGFAQRIARDAGGGRDLGPSSRGGGRGAGGAI